MQALPKKYKFAEIEEKWQQIWEELGIFHFDWEDTKKPTYSIDTPPPYPSGEFHMGNILNWTYFDMLARYKRMRGYNVLFPQGWDCHGLSIEIQVEKMQKIRKHDIPPDKFRSLCEQLIEKYIKQMKSSILKLGCSIDWTTEYRTMDPDYWRRTQLSFIQLYKKGYMYQGKHPVNWCPRCETAIADAEVDYQKRKSSLSYIRFPLKDNSKYLIIATSRPEFIPACVAVEVNPKDKRFRKYIGKEIVVPIVHRTVKIIEDDAVDPDFGTGVVMICTFGDKEDVKTVMKHKLPRIRIISDNGKINEKGGKYAGLSINQARIAIVEDLTKEGLLEKEEKLSHEVGVCDRCKTHIEILEAKQWFMKTRILTDDVIQTANEVVWYPNYMKTRLIDWAKSLDWDWVISRQRVFATPIPVWYCKDCDQTIVADEKWVPIDPKLEDPRINMCPKCGGKNFVPERDVFDTWMDSSISCAVHAGWPDRADWKHFFPADVHPSGIDIIRTWAYYLMVRHLALFNQTPYKSCLINGMVLGSDGKKMSKSLKNYVAAPEVLGKYGSDATRQWAAAGGITGSDIPFRWPDVEYGRRFLVKLWNVSKFSNRLLEDFTPNKKSKPELQMLDKWLLSKAAKLTNKVTQAMENSQFNVALEEIRNFTWHVLCDSYVEAVKDRLYRPEIHGQTPKEAAQHTLYNVLYKVLKFLCPVIPHLTEEIYQAMFANFKKHKSLSIASWPQPIPNFIDEEIENNGDMIIALITEIRREKAEKRLPLNAPIKTLTIYTKDSKTAEIFKQGAFDILGTCKVENLKVLAEKDTGKPVTDYPEVQFKTEL
jgi:valyl-tRNA synthetase